MKKWGLEFIRKLKPCYWKYKHPPLNDGKTHFGVVAQDVNAIASRQDFAFVGFKGEYLTVNYYQFIGPMIAAIQQLDKKIKKLEKELKDAKKNSNNSG
jgi:hypothetical protein